MKTLLELDVSDRQHPERVISFGVAESPAEKEATFRLRYSVYVAREYIDAKNYPEQIETDDYDKNGKSIYFAAVLDKKTIGCLRLIKDDPLPTEKYFDFTEPPQIQDIPRARRAEIGRFVIVPPNREKGEYLPRGLVSLFLFNALTRYGESIGIEGGYAFVKKSLETKLEKMKMPFVPIDPFVQKYPKDGVLFRYFTQPNDPVRPIGYRTADFRKRTDDIISSRGIFHKHSETRYAVRHTLYTAFLKKLKII